MEEDKRTKVTLAGDRGCPARPGFLILLFFNTLMHGYHWTTVHPLPQWEGWTENGAYILFQLSSLFYTHSCKAQTFFGAHILCRSYCRPVQRVSRPSDAYSFPHPGAPTTRSAFPLQPASSTENGLSRFYSLLFWY